MLRVCFADGSEVMLDAQRVLPPNTRPVQWETLEYDPYQITASTLNDESVEIPWSTIRVLTDDAYSAHLAHAAEEQARQIGLRIRELRDSRQLSSKDLAERAGIAPQSLSRIENGRHDVVYTTLQRLLAAMGYSLRDLAVTSGGHATIPNLLKRLADVGIDREFVRRRLLPDHSLTTSYTGSDSTNEERIVEAIAESVSRVFGWSVSRIVGSEPLVLDPSLVPAARFKVRGRVNELRATAYTFYAHYLALVVLRATSNLVPQPLPGDPVAFREAVLATYGSLDLTSLLRFTWDHGVPVVPLRDPGAFHGACWRIDGRNIIVLKQVTNSQARWAHDLLHETKHVADHLDSHRTAVIEGEEIALVSQPDAAPAEERQATEFAITVLLNGHAEALTQQAVTLAHESVERLKGTVQQVAKGEHAPVDALANYVAARLSSQGVNWWGAANNLQLTDPTPWSIARDSLLQHVALETLSDQDRLILMQAITSSEE
jgi:transcriptional regulator with XRE-family HTH domain